MPKPPSRFDPLAYGALAFVVLLPAWWISLGALYGSWDFLTPPLTLFALVGGVLAGMTRGWVRAALLPLPVAAFGLELALGVDLARTHIAPCFAADAACRAASRAGGASVVWRYVWIILISGAPLGFALVSGALERARARWAVRGMALLLAPLLFVWGVLLSQFLIPVPTRPPPFVPPAPRGVRVASEGRVATAVRTPGGFVWLECHGQEDVVKRWSRETGVVALGTGPWLTALTADGDRVTWVDDQRHVHVAEGADTWTAEGTAAASQPVHGAWSEHDEEGVVQRISADRHRVDWSRADGTPIASFVVPDAGSPFHAHLGETDVFWWTEGALGIEPRH